MDQNESLDRPIEINLFHIGSVNNFLGHGAGSSITTGENNIAFGNNAATALTTGNNNVLLGYNSGDTLASGNNNILIGHGSDVSDASAENRITIGADTNTLDNSLLLASNITSVAIGSTQEANTFSLSSSITNVKINLQQQRTSNVVYFDANTKKLTYDISTSGNNYFDTRNTSQGENAFNVESDLIHNLSHTADNSAFGYSALALIQSNENSAFGSYSISNTISGGDNSAFGFSSLKNNTSGSKSTAFGANALLNNNSSENSAFGYEALFSNVNGLYNSAFGFQSLHDSDSTNNTAFGYKALNKVQGSHNTGIGSNALREAVEGDYNTVTGYQVAVNNISGDYNTASGASALFTNTTGNRNTSCGYQSLYFNNASDNNAYGHLSLYSNTTGTYNNAFGTNTLQSNTEGYENSAFGYNAMKLNITGDYNVAIGSNALLSNTYANNNVAIGCNSLLNTNNNDNLPMTPDDTLNTANNNVAVGNNTLLNNISGGNNTAIGHNAGYNNNGSNNVLIGYECAKNSTTLNDKLIIANNASSNLITGDFTTGNVDFKTTSFESATTIGKNSLTLTETDVDFTINTVGNGRIAVNNSYPINSNHLTTKDYVDNYAKGLKVRQEVKTKTSSNLASIYNNGVNGVGATLIATANGSIGIINNYTLNLNDRILVDSQDDKKQNGIYEVKDLGSDVSKYILLRTSDMDGSPYYEVTNGIYVYITNGFYGNRGYVLSNPSIDITGPSNTILIGTDPIYWVQFMGINLGNLTSGYLLKIDNTNNIASTSVSSYISGTSNQVIVNDNLNGTITLSLPQSISTTSNVTFATITADINNSSRGFYNVFIGKNSGKSTTTSSYNIGIGESTLSTVTTAGGNNIAIGNNSLNLLTSGAGNIALGPSTGASLTSGGNNIFIGTQCGQFATSGTYNIAIGSLALCNVTTTSYNVAIGHGSLRSLTTGGNNIGLGYFTGILITTGSNNMMLGNNSGSAITTGSNNTITGYNSGSAITTGNNNTIIGNACASTITTGSNNIYLGSNLSALNSSVSNECVIGYNITGLGSNTMTYGNTSIVSHNFRGGRINITDTFALVSNGYGVNQSGTITINNNTLTEVYKYYINGSINYTFNNNLLNTAFLSIKPTLVGPANFNINIPTTLNLYGLYIQPFTITTASITNAYGAYITAPTTGTHKCGLYSDSISVGYSATDVANDNLIVKGYISIGTSSIGAKLNVVGDAYISQSLIIGQPAPNGATGTLYVGDIYAQQTDSRYANFYAGIINSINIMSDVITCNYDFTGLSNATINGNLGIGTGYDAVIPIVCNNNYNYVDTWWSYAFRCYGVNMSSGKQLIFTFGKDSSPGNMAELVYTYVGDDSADNSYGFTFYGYGDFPFSIYKDGRCKANSLGVNTLPGTYTFNVSGTSYLSSDTQINGKLLLGGAENGSSTGTIIYMANVTTAPSTDPTAGGILYVEGGALKFRGSSGTVTTLAPA